MVDKLSPESVINAFKNFTSNQKETVKKALGISGLMGGTSFQPLGGITNVADEIAARYETQQELLKSIGNTAAGLRSQFSELEKFSKDLTGSTGEANAAIRALAEGMQSLTFRSAEQTIELGRAAITLKNLGVSYSDFGQILDTAALGFGKNQKELMGLATQLGTIVKAYPGQASTIARNFQKAQSSLAYDSSKIMDVFKKLQMTSSATGVGFEKLTGAFGDSMDTFQGSSQKAGQLNAILGKNVFNSIDLLGKSEGERVETIVSGLRRNLGGSVNQLGKFQLKAVAEGLGLGVEDTRRLLSGQTTVDKAMASKATSDPRVRAQQILAEALDANNESIQDLTGAFKEVRPVLENVAREAEITIRKKLTQAIAGSLGLGGDKEIKSTTDIIDKASLAAAVAGAQGEEGFTQNFKKNIQLNTDELRKLRREQGGAKLAEEVTTSKAFKKVLDAIKRRDLGQIVTLSDNKLSVNAKNLIDESNTRLKPDPEKPDPIGNPTSPDDGLFDKIVRYFSAKPIEIELTGNGKALLKIPVKGGD